ncbi:hypothetical protein AAE478_003226 [Parahypoxylon ruwenzoriense]
MFNNFIWKTYGALWLDHAAEGKLGDLSLDAAKALAQLSFGLDSGVRDVQLKGVAQYGKCLRALAEGLGEHCAAARSSQSFVVPILVLMMVSAIQEDRAAAIFHLKAIGKVLVLCGPEAFQRQPLRNAFEAARATLVIASLFSRRRTFLEDVRWQDIPWALDPSAKPPQSHLLDIFAVIPGLLEDDSHLDDESFSPEHDFPDPSLISDEHLARRTNLCSRIAVQLEKLYRWRFDWQKRYGQYITTDASQARPNDVIFKARGSISDSRNLGRLQFARFVYANDIALYNAALMWLMALIWKLEPLRAASIIKGCAQRAAGPLRPPLSPVPPALISNNISFDPLHRPGSSFSIRDPAMEICRIFDWQCRHYKQNSSSDDQTCLYLFPLGMARGVLNTDSDMQKWINEMLDSNPITTGYDSNGRGVVGFNSYVTKQALHLNIGRAEDSV